MIYLFIWLLLGIIAAGILFYTEAIKNKEVVTLSDLGILFLIFILGLFGLIIVLIFIFKEYGNTIIYNPHKKK